MYVKRDGLNILKKMLSMKMHFFFVYLGDRKIGYNRMRFLLESLKDLDDNLKLRGGCLYILQGNPVDIFEKIKNEIGLDLVSFEQVNIYLKCNLLIKINNIRSNSWHLLNRTITVLNSKGL